MTTMPRGSAVLGVGLAFVLAIAVGGQRQRVWADTTAGSLLIESDPAGASVYVDGRLAGQTPLSLQTVAAGVHRVRLLRLGYLENSRLVTVKGGSHATVRARLTSPQPQTAGQAALRIVVLEGEGAVNIIQQKTAVAPVVEVRDRNDQPVAGAIVRFAIRSGRATFSGARTLSVTTDAGGRAVAAGFAPTGTGGLQIGATAAFQGQTAAITIAQTTVTTAAQAAAASSAAGASAGGGGGLSTTTIGVIAGAAAGGVVGIKALANSSTIFRGPFSGIWTMTAGTCTFDQQATGIVEMDIEVSDSGVEGESHIDGSQTIVRLGPQCSFTLNSTESLGCCRRPMPVNGTEQTLSFRGSEPGNAGSTWTYTFTGALSDSTITGVFTVTVQSQTPPTSGTGTFPVTLTKQ